MENPFLLIALILFFVLLGFVFYKQAFGKGKKVSVLYGYPAYRKTWLTVYHYRKTDKWEFEWDDLFDSGRPSSWGPKSQCLMYEDKKSGATKEEFHKAWAMLNARGLLS